MGMVKVHPSACPCTVPGPITHTRSREPSRCHSMWGGGTASSGHSRMSCPPATAVMLGVSPTLAMLRGAVGHVPAESGGAMWVGHPHTCPHKSCIDPCSAGPPCCAPDPSSEASSPYRSSHPLPSNPKEGCRGCSGSLVPQSSDHPAAPPVAPSSLHHWGHATLDADVEAPAVLPGGASSQAGVQASVGHLHKARRGKN